MSQDLAGLKVKRDAAITALFSLHRAAGDASSAILDLINHLDDAGFDASDLRAAFGGTITANQKKPSRGSKTVDTVTGPAEPEVDATLTNGSASKPKSSEELDQNSKVEDNAEKTKKPKRARDPNAPKRPLNAYLRFRNQEQKRISQDRKDKGETELSRADMIATVKNSWDNLPKAHREELDRECKEDLERYHTLIAAYKANTGEVSSQSEAAVNGQQANRSDGEHSSQEPLTQETVSEEPATQDASQDASSPAKRKPKRKDEKKKKKSKTE